ncbi:unnamed protein product [Penicillium roqueforti FM164]|uniref:Genomic scaffold, ProqFM164S02 n=1 Tax=Penicillium roqueforti (strain FM164) TaxID=1365484 RepID=W6Q9Q9_PENRF|nr:unnamed protein product [Penicillium roqueforti FM164]
MATPGHSAAVEIFASKLMVKLAIMERETAIQGFPGVTITVGNRGKQHDYGWGPLHRPGYGRKRWSFLKLRCRSLKPS